jgi:uncharacterized membrane protein YjfL (UPF0719 family)
MDGVIIALLQLFVSFAFSVSAVYVGLSLLDRLTKSLRGWERVKKGNVAVGILYAAVIFSLVIMIEPSIISTVLTLNTSSNALYTFAANLLVLVIALLIAVLSIYILLRIIDMITVDVHELEEISKGNVSMALITGSALVAVSFVVQTAISYLVSALTI